MTDAKKNGDDVEGQNAPMIEKNKQEGISSAGYKVLLLLAVQNCVKNLVTRVAVQGDAHFLYSAAVLATESTKCTASLLYIFIVERGTPAGVIRYLRAEWKKFLLLMVPAAVYNFQQMLEYVALKNLDPALFAVLVQSKLLTTAIFRAGLMGMRLRRSQVVSLLLLTTGVMLAQLHKQSDAPKSEHPTTGVLATVGIALFSGFASVYTEKVIKRHKAVSTDEGVPSGLAYTQVQLALTSLIIGGTWALVTDWTPITTKGLWYGFDYKACIAAVNSAAGGLTVAAVLKYADAVLKGYATAISVLLTGVLSMVLFGTELSVEYALGMTNVLAAVFLYNAQDLEKHAW